MSFLQHSSSGKFVPLKDDRCHFRTLDATILGKLDEDRRAQVRLGEKVPFCFQHDGFIPIMLILVDPNALPPDEGKVIFLSTQSTLSHQSTW